MEQAIDPCDVYKALFRFRLCDVLRPRPDLQPLAASPGCRSAASARPLLRCAALRRAATCPPPIQPPATPHSAGPGCALHWPPKGRAAHKRTGDCIAAARPPPIGKCTAAGRSPEAPQLTAAGQPCKRGRILGSTACKSHAKRDGLMPVVPTECCICYEDLTDETRTVTPCNHHFHKGCVGRWLGTNSSCPMCRTTVPRATRTRLAAAT